MFPLYGCDHLQPQCTDYMYQKSKPAVCFKQHNNPTCIIANLHICYCEQAVHSGKKANTFKTTFYFQEFVVVGVYKVSIE